MQLERASAPLSCGGRDGKERRTAPSSPLWAVADPVSHCRKSSEQLGSLGCSAVPRGSCRVLSNNSPACSAGFLAMRTAQALIHGLAECRENGKDIAF